MATVTNVPTHITATDELIFKATLNLRRPPQPLSFEQEIQLIKDVQNLILKEAPSGPPIPDYMEREPHDLLRHRSGLCYDRSRTYDKVFNWLGFGTRHVYILYPEHPKTHQPLPYWRAFFTRGTQSHAVTEVKTQRGWLLVDSNSPWISLRRDGSPVSADHLPHNKNDFESPLPVYFDRDYLAIRGLYSRRGQLYRPYLPFPALNWWDFGSSLLSID